MASRKMRETDRSPGARNDGARVRATLHTNHCTNILDVPCAKAVIAVDAGRNLAVLVEATGTQRDPATSAASTPTRNSSSGTSALWNAARTGLGGRHRCCVPWRRSARAVRAHFSGAHDVQGERVLLQFRIHGSAQRNAAASRSRRRKTPRHPRSIRNK